MSTPTRQRSANQRARTAPSAKSAKNARTGGGNRTRAKQTARIEGLRDGKPLIFGWGKHLTRAQKLRYQHLATWSFIGVICLAIVGTLVYGLVNENIIVPNKTIASVNGVNIAQDTYRKELAYQSQTLWNRLQSEIAQRNALQAKAQTGDTTAATEYSIVTSQLQSDEANYAVAQITQASMSTLEDNALIVQGEKTFEQQNHVSASTFEPTQKEVNDALAAFKKAFPNGETYAQFLSADNLSNGDVVNSITMQLRRTKMQTYLAGLIVSPSRQVHLRRIQIDTKANAEKVRSELVAGKLTDATWSTVAKKYSLDTNSKDTGGEIGWVPQWTGDGGIELWAYASDRKVGDLSPVISDTSGTFDVVQIVGIDPSRTIDATTLKAAQDNALSHWLGIQRVSPSAKITTADATMMTASRNMPKKPNLNAALPAITPAPGAGFP